jgi:hypothetical protein
MTVAVTLLMSDTNEKCTGRDQGGRGRGPIEQLSLGQGIFYLAAGVWPLLNMRTFERVTGPKSDKWLVKTAGALITAIGGALALAGASRRVSPEIELLAVTSAAGLTAIDIVYVTKGRISPVFLLDAVAELALIGGWLAASRPNPRIIS